MNPETKWNNKGIFNIVLCLLLPLFDGTLLALLLSKRNIEKPLNIFQRRFVAQLVLECMIQSAFHFKLAEIKIRVTVEQFLLDYSLIVLIYENIQRIVSRS